MKKSVTLLTSAALALTILSSTAMAETTKTSANYTDLSQVDSALKAKIDTLLSKGIMEGVSENTFGIEQTMTRAQFAKVATLVFGLSVDTNLKTSSFSDVLADDPANGWAIPYIEAARAAGLIDGITDSTFAPGDPVTVGQLDTLLLKGLGYKVDVTASPWYANAVKQASELGIHPADKAGDTQASRADLVTGAYASLTSTPPTAGEQVSLISATANGDFAVDVKLDLPVDSSMAKLTLTKDGNTIPTTVAWSSDKKNATLNLTQADDRDDDELKNGTYRVTLSGISNSLIKVNSLTFTVGTPGPSATTGDLTYYIPETYELKNVIDSSLTELASGYNGYATQLEAEDPTTSMFAKEVEIKAVDKSGNEVAIPGIIQSITSSSPSIVKAAVSSDHRGYILGNKEGTATISVTYTTGSGNKQMSFPVQVKSSDLTAEKIEARDKGIYTYASVSNTVYSAQFNAYEEMDLKVTDNFGIEYEQDEIQSYNFALNVYFTTDDIIGDPAAGEVGTVNIDPAGIVHVTGNVTDFTLTAHLLNEQTALADVHVRKNGPIED